MNIDYIAFGTGILCVYEINKVVDKNNSMTAMMEIIFTIFMIKQIVNM